MGEDASQPRRRDDYEPPEWAQELLQGQRHTSQRLQQITESQEDHGRRLEAQGKALEEYGDALDDLKETVSDFNGRTTANFARIGAEFDSIKERAREDRERADRKEVEYETKVGKAHQNNQNTDSTVGRLRGEFDNHIKDNHATVALQVRTDLDKHANDNNRHTGEAPGLGGAAKTTAIAGGSAGIIVLIYKLAEIFLAGGT